MGHALPGALRQRAVPPRCGATCHRPFRFLCITDDTDGPRSTGVETCAFPDNPGITQARWPNVFMKLVITRDGFADLAGPTLFLDLDLVVLDDIDCFFDYHPGRYCIIHNWIECRKQLPPPAPADRQLLGLPLRCRPLERDPRNLPPRDQRRRRPLKFRTEQAFLTHAMKQPAWWPEDRGSAGSSTTAARLPAQPDKTPRPPAGAKFLVFHGKPDPDDAVNGVTSANSTAASAPPPGSPTTGTTDSALAAPRPRFHHRAPVPR